MLRAPLAFMTPGGRQPTQPSAILPKGGRYAHGWRSDHTSFRPDAEAFPVMPIAPLGNGPARASVAAATCSRLAVTVSGCCSKAVPGCHRACCSKPCANIVTLFVLRAPLALRHRVAVMGLACASRMPVTLLVNGRASARCASAPALTARVAKVSWVGLPH